MATVPIVSPAGDVGDVPFAQMQAALAAGGKPGVTIKSPDGRLGVVPADRYQDVAAMRESLRTVEAALVKEGLLAVGAKVV